MFPLRYTIRLLLKSPGFALTAVLILGCGVGANTAIFSLVNAVLLKPLPYPQPDSLVQICQGISSSPDTQFDYPDYQDLRQQQTSFADLAAIRTWHFDLSDRGDPVRLTGGFVSASFFKVFSIPFLLGRSIAEKEDTPGGPLVAVINERIWKGQFDADPAIIGKKITLDNQSFLIVGVAPAQIEDWTAGLDVLLPLNAMPVLGDHGLSMRANRRLDCYGRLKERVTLSQAQAECELIQKSLCERYPDSNKGYSIRTVLLLRNAVGDYTATLWLIETAVACLLLIACANVANLFLARAIDRKKEMNIRAAIGASRIRLVYQLAFEIASISVLGGLLGLLIASWAIEFIKYLSPQEDLARFQRVSLDVTALSFCFGATLVTSSLFGILPVWSLSKTNPGAALRDENSRSGTASRQRQRLQSLLVTAQVALACILLRFFRV
jgi:putative ABC transport system permease protein